MTRIAFVSVVPFQFAKSFLSRAKMCPDWPGGDPRRHIPRSEGVRATQLQPTELSPSRHQPSNERPTHRPTLRVPHTCTISGTPTILPPILPAIILEMPPTYLFYIWLNLSFTQTMNWTVRCSVGSTSVISLEPWPIHCCCTLVALSRLDTHAPAAASDPNLAELFQAWPYSTQSLRFTFHSALANQDQPHHINFLAKNSYNQLTCMLWISHMFLATSLWKDILCGQAIYLSSWFGEESHKHWHL